MFKDKIKLLRDNLHLTQKELADKLEMSNSSISMWERGERFPADDKTLIKLSAFFGVTLDELMDNEVKANELLKMEKLPSNAIPLTDMINIPIIGEVRAGEGGFADESIIGYEAILSSTVKNPSECFFLRVAGDSMYPRYCDGDLVLIRKQSSVDSGSYAVVIVDGEEGLVKRVIYGDDFIELHSTNPMYKTRVFTGSDVLQVRVIGRVIKTIREE